MAVVASPAKRFASAVNNKSASSSAKPAQVEHPILFQTFFKSVGPRTYAAQVKKATNGNHYLVLTEGRRDEKTGEVYKKRINVFSEDFEAFFGLMRDFAAFNKAHPVPENVPKTGSDVAKEAKQTHHDRSISITEDFANQEAGALGDAPAFRFQKIGSQDK